ncbi:hypothetical protein N7481_000162 [Penicillium waksmanii]|uniref:uncharacterized protein n=1 Tax=Penicillium waksmanii TaxID=69791 RepID=UPI002546D912|nr:uncharacterized protein N7481_000162 [Penicillium waksmanii]KAJ5999753.1 hypothetical protein N7481_000162 [Penicillium waksmanii]
MSLPDEPLTWQRPGFLISTDKTILSLQTINHAFSLDIVYWTNPVPEDILATIVENSFCFGLYEISNPSTTTTSPEDRKQIGFARLVGDKVTFAYFTDLYVLPQYQGLGLGGWVIDCIGEVVDQMPYLRWAMLRTSLEQSRVAYEKRLGMRVLLSGDIQDGPVMMGKRGVTGGP